MDSQTPEPTTEVSGSSASAGIDYKVGVNRLFELSLATLAAARTLPNQARSIEMQAKNGIVHAARISGSEAKPLAALTGILASLPDQLATEVDALEKACGILAGLAAECANRFRRFFQIWRALAVSAGKHTGYRLSISENDLRRGRLSVLYDQISHWRLEAQEASNVRSMIGHAEAQARELGTVLTEVRLAVSSNQRVVERMNAIALTARYMVLNMKMEAARMGEADAKFSTLASAIESTVDQLANRLSQMDAFIAQSSAVLRSLQSGRHGTATT